MIDRFLHSADAKRALHTLQKLSRHDTTGWALAGGFAVEIHCLRGEQPPSTRRLNDIDFVASAFDCIPETLAEDFLFRHVHPFDPPGKTILQLVDAETALRIDLFRAYGEIMRRTVSVNLLSGPMQLISQDDIQARAARLLLDLGGGIPVPAKHADNYLRLERLVQPFGVEVAWPDHRKPGHPKTFREASTLVQRLIATHRDLLINVDYSKDATQGCPRCVAQMHSRWRIRISCSRCSGTASHSAALSSTVFVYA